MKILFNSPRSTDHRDLSTWSSNRACGRIGHVELSCHRGHPIAIHYMESPRSVTTLPSHQRGTSRHNYYQWNHIGRIWRIWMQSIEHCRRNESNSFRIGPPGATHSHRTGSNWIDDYRGRRAQTGMRGRGLAITKCSLEDTEPRARISRCCGPRRTVLANIGAGSCAQIQCQSWRWRHIHMSGQQRRRQRWEVHLRRCATETWRRW